MNLLRSIVSTTWLFISVVLISPFVLLARLLSYEAAYAVAMFWRDTVLFVFRAVSHLDYEVDGADNVPADACVLMIKHTSSFETVVQMALFPRQCWVLKRELMWVPFLGWALACVRPIAINRGGGRSAVNQVVTLGFKRLEHGIFVAIFPEGTRVAPDETGRYGLSGALLARRAERPIVPVAHDAGDYWPRRGLRKRPGTATFRIGPPIETAGRDPRDIIDDVRNWIESSVRDIRDLKQHDRNN